MTKYKLSATHQRETINFYVFTAPWLIGFLWLTVYPIIKSLFLSFTDSGYSGSNNFIGLENYIKAFTLDSRFLISFKNTLVYMLIFVPSSLILSFIIGWLLSRKVRCLGFFRIVFYIPYITAGVAVTIMWGWIFNSSYGMINYVLNLFGIQGPNWLGDKHTALLCIVIMNLWAIGNNILIMLSGIQDIPSSYFESAEIDGASTLRQIFSITLPLCSPTIFFNLVISIIYSLQLFDQPYILTNGGPVDSTRTVAMLIFQNAFEYGKMGYASCVAWCLFIVIITITMIIQASARHWVFYDN
jgi:multiple sugar transport system permease protein